jgi:hypothetical protein
MSDRNSLTRPPPEKSGCLQIAGWVAVAGALTTALTLVLFWRMTLEITQDSRRIAESIAAGFEKALNFTPQVSVDSLVVVAANSPVLELVTLQKQALVRSQWTHTWLYSTKNVELEAVFTARAGFDLSDPIRINIDPRTRFVAADLPPPKLLSLGMGEVRVLQDEDGLWNKLTAHDREEAFHTLEEKARELFAKSNLLPEARIEGEKRIRQLIDQTAWSTAPVISPSDKSNR